MNVKKTPTVTIMIPVYNQQEYILDAVYSALAQTYPHLEIIVGDDASTDNTWNILSDINDPRLKKIRNSQNLGRSRNYRNILFNHAGGDFVVNLDGDDYFTDPCFINDAVARIVSDDIVMVAAKAVTDHAANGSNSKKISKIPDKLSCNGLEILTRVPSSRYMFMHISTIYSRKHAVELDFYRTDAMSSDWESLFRLCLRGTTCYLDKVVACWRIHGTNETGSINIDNHINNLAIWDSIYYDAVQFGMPLWLALLLKTNCRANLLTASFVRIARKKKWQSLKLLYTSCKRYPITTAVIFFHPLCLPRVLLSLFNLY